MELNLNSVSFFSERRLDFEVYVLKVFKGRGNLSSLDSIGF